MEITIGTVGVNLNKEDKYELMIGIIILDDPSTSVNYEDSGWMFNVHRVASDEFSAFVSATETHKIFGRGNGFELEDGVFPLTVEHLEELEEKRDKFIEKHPNVTPDCGTTKEDRYLAQLDIYIFWIGYTIANYDNPAIELSHAR